VEGNEEEGSDAEMGAEGRSNSDAATYFKKLDKRFGKLKHKHEKSILKMFEQATGPLSN
jgi:hypothetical protein